MHWNFTSTFIAERGAVSQQPSWPATSASPETTGSLQQQMSPKGDSLACDYTCSLETQQGHQGNMRAQTETGPAPASAQADQPGRALWGLGTPCTIGSHPRRAAAGQSTPRAPAHTCWSSSPPSKPTRHMQSTQVTLPPKATPSRLGEAANSQKQRKPSRGGDRGTCS